MTQEISRNSDGSVDSYEVYEYDQGGNKISATSYDKDGSVTSVKKFEDGGNSILTYYDKDGSVTSVLKQDKYGNLIW